MHESKGRYTLNLSIFDLVLSATRLGPATLSKVLESLNIVLHMPLTSSSSCSALISAKGPKIKSTIQYCTMRNFYIEMTTGAIAFLSFCSK